MGKILIVTIHVNLVQNSPELSLLKFLPLTYHHSHFLAATLDFTFFFTIAFLRAALFFTAWIRFHFFLYLYTPRPALGLFPFFSLSHRKNKKMKQILNTLTNSDFISKCTNYIYIIYIIYTFITCHLFPTDNLFEADLSTG